MAQEEVDLYTGLAQATGGQVSPDVEKNFWYLLEFQWDKQGKWSLVNNDVQLMINTNKGRLPIHCLAPSKTSRILVVANWVDRVWSGHIRKEDAWYYYQTTLSKLLEYPLLATTLTEKECRSIEAPALKMAIQCSGTASNLHWCVLFGSSKCMGLHGKRLFFIQGLKHFNALLDHGNSDNITGRQMRACIEWHKMEVGTG
eukprot:15332764-Ditylum_brightwellii.AAC.1